MAENTKSEGAAAKKSASGAAKEAPKKEASAKSEGSKAVAAKPAAAAKKSAPKSDAKPKADKAKKPSASGKTITVKQIGSPIGRPAVQRQTLIGLGLNKMHRVRTLEDTPSVRGMIAKLPHLVTIVE